MNNLGCFPFDYKPSRLKSDYKIMIKSIRSFLKLSKIINPPYFKELYPILFLFYAILKYISQKTSYP